jgi:hypothetical protein
VAKKKARNTGSSAGLARLTRQQVLDGVSGPDGVRIGFAVPEEAGAVAALLKAAADDLETGHLEALARGRCGTWLLDALAGGDLGEPFVRATAAGELQAAVAQLSLPLVARDGDGQVTGALLGVPSGTVVSGLSRLSVSRQQILMSMLTFAKIKAIALLAALHRLEPAGPPDPRTAARPPSRHHTAVALEDLLELAAAAGPLAAGALAGAPDAGAAGYAIVLQRLVAAAAAAR